MIFECFCCVTVVDPMVPVYRVHDNEGSVGEGRVVSCLHVQQAVHSNHSLNFPLKMGKPKTYPCTVQVAGLEEDFECSITRKTKGDYLFEKLCEYISLVEKEYFGLRYIDEKDGQFNWLESDKGILSQMRKAPLHFYFAVKFYPDNPTTLREDITRYHFVLQLREDLLKGRLQCSNPIHALLGSYIVQAELGDYSFENHDHGYLRDFKFLSRQPHEVLNKVEEFHKKHIGMSPADAEFQYLDNVRKLPLYGRDLHQAWDAEGQAVTLGVSAWGIELFHNNRLMQRFIWPKIITISFKSKKFSLTLRAASDDDQYRSTTVSFAFSSRRASKRIWKVCVEHHSFFRLKTPAPVQSNPGLFRVGSKFRYCGRTQHQARHNELVETRDPPSFERVSSKRFSMKVLDSNRRSMLIDDDSKKDKTNKALEHDEEKKEEKRDEEKEVPKEIEKQEEKKPEEPKEAAPAEPVVASET